MRKLTIQNDFRSSQIPAKLFIIENKISAQLPSFFKDLLFMVEGSTIKENVYYDKERRTFFSIHQFLEIDVIEKAADKIEKMTNGDVNYISCNELLFIPFAIDSGGWSYHISLAKVTYNEIWLNCFDNNEENPFNFVASSLEEFVNGLITESEAIKLGY